MPANLLFSHVYVFTYLHAGITTGHTKIQLKINLSLYRYESLCGSGGVASFMSATNDVSDKLHSSAALLTRKLPAVAIDKKNGWIQSWSGRFEREKASCLYRESKQNFLGPPSKLVTVPTAPSWLQKLIKNKNRSGQATELLLLLLLLLLLSSSLLLLLSSMSPLCRVSTLIFLRKTMSLGNTVLQLFWCNYSWCVYR